MSETALNVGPEASSSSKGTTRKKPAPNSGEMPIVFSYSPSRDGVDENLLILLHGLGEKLGICGEITPAKTLKERGHGSPVCEAWPATASASDGDTFLEGTWAVIADLLEYAILIHLAELCFSVCWLQSSFCCGYRIPYLYENAFQWYESFDQLGELIAHPNPTSALDILDQIVRYLVDEDMNQGCGWSLDRIHFFGYGQGGTVIAEFALRLWRRQSGNGSDRSSQPYGKLGSIVSVEGPLLEFPTLKPPCATPSLYFHRSKRAADPSASSFLKGFSDAKEVRVGGAEGMPRSKEEWARIIEFWSRVLASRMPEMEGLHPVISGGPTLATS